MNRRSFFTKLGIAAATISILPSATTYARQWVAPTAVISLWVPNPAWDTAPYEKSTYVGYGGGMSIFKRNGILEVENRWSDGNKIPNRFTIDPVTGIFIPVPKMILR